MRRYDWIIDHGASDSSPVSNLSLGGGFEKQMPSHMMK
jgi:hypothetical protein